MSDFQPLDPCIWFRPKRGGQANGCTPTPAIFKRYTNRHRTRLVIEFTDPTGTRVEKNLAAEWVERPSNYLFGKS